MQVGSMRFLWPVDVASSAFDVWLLYVLYGLD